MYEQQSLIIIRYCTLQIFVLAIVALMMYLKRDIFGHILSKFSAYILNLLITLYFTMQNQLFRKTGGIAYLRN